MMKTTFKKLSSDQHLFFDLDREPSEKWSKNLKEILHLPHRPKKITLLYNPLAFDHKKLLILEQLSNSAEITIIEKPLDVGILIRNIKNTF